MCGSRWVRGAHARKPDFQSVPCCQVHAAVVLPVIYHVRKPTLFTKALPNHIAPQIASAWPNILRILISVLADAVSHTMLLLSESAAALASACTPNIDGGPQSPLLRGPPPMPRALGDGPYLSPFPYTRLQTEPRSVMWLPFAIWRSWENPCVSPTVPRAHELTSQPPVPLSSPDFYRIWKSFGPPPTYPPSSPNRVTMVDCAAPRLEWSRGIDFSKW